MERPLTHRQIQELLGAYALDAVDPDEAAAIEAHLPECPRCRDEVAGHREAAALLAHVGASAPEGVWDRIAERLEEGAGEGEGGREGGGEGAGEGGGERASGPGGGGGRPPLVISQSHSAAAAADIVEQAQGRVGDRPDGPGRPGRPGRPGLFAAPRPARPRRAAGARFLAAGLAAAALIAVVLGVQVSRLDHRLDRVLTAMSERGVDQAALAAVTDPDARHVRLTSDDGARLADAVLLPNGQAYLVAQSLPALSDAETYQLWAVVDDEKISVGVLGAHPNVAAFHYDGQPTVLAITAERAGGVVASKKQAVVAGTVPPLST